LREAVWQPFLGFLGRHRAIEILAFVLFYKFADQLAQSLQRPFLVDMGYSDIDRGLAVGTVGLVGALVGTFLGGALTTRLGLGHSLWVFGLLQIFSNLGFILVSQSDVDRPLMYGAMGFEALTTGLGMGAFGVLLLRMTQRRFSATQYALFSSLFALPRLVAGPITGFTVDALGWTAFFWITMLAGIPGLVLLARFVPPGLRDPTFAVEAPRDRKRLSTAALALRATLGGVIALTIALVCMASLAELKASRGSAGHEFSLLSSLSALIRPEQLTAWVQLLGSIVFGVACALLTAAVFAARHGAGLNPPGSEEDPSS
jgi:PAT family beta-lactamase induction signal transducer AmpG